MKLPGALGHLTYCTNIHAGEAWPDVAASLREHLPRIRDGLSPQLAAGAPLGVGLRLAAAAATALEDDAAFAELEALLGDDYYVFTFNGFPYGAFHGQPVKDGAYRPDWSEPQRLDYTNRLAGLMARLLPDGMDGTISTVPCTFKPWLDAAPDADARIERCAQHLIAHAAELWKLRERTGRTIVLALEPEPYCLLETIAETVEFFETRLFGTQARAAMSAHTGLGAGAAESALRAHLGVCYDVCHAAVEYEDAGASLMALRNAGIVIGKLQLSSALRIVDVDDASAAALAAFDEPVYLHQTMARANGTVTRYPDLAPALASRGAAPAIDHGVAERAGSGVEWRSHFHVPIFLEDMMAFGTTQGFLREILALHRAAPVTQQLEVETYTWDVLPDQFRNVPVSDAIARELRWVIDTLAASA